jgi:hypothetical protein
LDAEFFMNNLGTLDLDDPDRASAGPKNFTDHAVIDRIIDHLTWTFVAERPPLECVFQDLLMVSDPPVEYFP